MNGESKKTLISIIIPLISLLVGVGMTYGILREKVNTLTFESRQNTTLIRKIDQRLSYIEGALSLTKRPFNKPKLGIQNKD